MFLSSARRQEKDARQRGRKRPKNLSLHVETSGGSRRRGSGEAASIPQQNRLPGTEPALIRIDLEHHQRYAEIEGERLFPESAQFANELPGGTAEVL